MYTGFVETGGNWRDGKGVEFYSLSAPVKSCRLPDLPDERVSHTQVSLSQSEALL